MLIARQFALELCFKEACRREERALLRQHEEQLHVFDIAAAINAETSERLDASARLYTYERRRRERIFKALTGYQLPVDTS